MKKLLKSKWTMVGLICIMAVTVWAAGETWNGNFSVKNYISETTCLIETVSTRAILAFKTASGTCQIYKVAGVAKIYSDSDIVAPNFWGVLIGSFTGNVTGNVTGSSGSCTGNAATATTAASCSGNSATATTAGACSGNSATATTAATVTNGVYTNSENVIGAAHMKGASSTKLANGSSGNLLKSLGDGTFAWDTTTYLSGVTAHNLLSTTHGDTTAGSVARGDIMVGKNASPKWEKLELGTTGKCLVSDGTDVGWSASALGTMAWATDTDYTTKATLTEKGDIMYASAASTPAALAHGTAGQLLRTGGNGANPAWTTPTYPNIGTAGKVLVGDGTNIVLSTPTFPNASATSRKMIVSDGTNWVASTELWPIATTSGNILVADGTNWTTSAPSLAKIGNGTAQYQVPVTGATPFAPAWTTATGTGAPVLATSPTVTGLKSDTYDTSTAAGAYKINLINALWLGGGSYNTNLIGGNGGASLNNTTSTEAYYNTFFGIDSGVAATKTAHSTGVGNNSLSSLTTGASNTAVGAYALANVTTQADNVAIGTNAGRYEKVGTGANPSTQSTYIGSGTRGYAGGGATNEIVIGYNAIGDGSNTATLGNTGITKTILQGKIAIGTTTTPGQLLSINSSATNVNSLVEFKQGDVAQATIGMGSDNNLYVNSVAGRPIILLGGLVGVGKTPAAGTGLDVDSSLNPYWNNNAHWYTSSDATLKEDIQTIPNALAIVKSLRGTTFKWKDKTKRDNKTHIGLIAQEVEEVIPNWVKTGADGIKGIVVENDTALFIEAIKEQDAKITALETTVATQQKLIDDLVARIEKLGKK